MGDGRCTGPWGRWCMGGAPGKHLAGEESGQVTWGLFQHNGNLWRAPLQRRGVPSLLAQCTRSWPCGSTLWGKVDMEKLCFSPKKFVLEESAYYSPSSAFEHIAQGIKCTHSGVQPLPASLCITAFFFFFLNETETWL